jgi:gamma-glutamylcyclotransferase (GGCT)/AIG2-like uncharacterized protein YtfP
MPLLFSYGTLQQEAVQRATFGRKLNGQPDELPGHERVTIEITNPEFVAASGRSLHANVVEKNIVDCQVAGAALEVTDDELLLSDSYERAAGYARRLVTLRSGKRAWVYAYVGP